MIIFFHINIIMIILNQYYLLILVSLPKHSLKRNRFFDQHVFNSFLLFYYQNKIHLDFFYEISYLFFYSFLLDKLHGL